jgi:two-component system sensor kinase
MLLDPRLAELLLRWEQYRIEGVEVPAEELCRDCPELLDEFLEKLLSVQNTLHTLSPPTRGAAERESSEHSSPGGLPTIGDYQILYELGQGGMGVVYQAYDRKRCEMVALKTLHRSGASAIYRLKQEFRSLAEVTHPNLAALYELICTGQIWVIAMELIDGINFLAYVCSSQVSGDHESSESVQGSSKTELKSATGASRSESGHRPLPPQNYDRLRSALFQLVHGVLVLHSHGKLHRDIKPSNVLVTWEGRVVLLDFGLAADLNQEGVHESTEQHLTGTVAYMSPEQAAGLPLSVASDWYSVGVMLYEALTGRLPLSGTLAQLLNDKEKRVPLEPARIVCGIPEDLNSLCVDLLRSSPEARPTGATVLHRLSEQVLRKTLVSANAAASRQAVFVGRDAHLRELSDAFETVQRGCSSLIRLEGRSGAGKSMLAQHFLDRLMQQGRVVVLAGKCYERESVPYKTLDSLVDALSRYLRRLPDLEVQAILPREAQVLAQVFPALQRVASFASTPLRPLEIVDPHELQRRAFEALKELLARLGDRKPLILFIDDLQWGDVDGATQLAALLRPPGAPIIMLIASYRSEDTGSSPCLSILQRAFDKLGTALDQRTLSVDPLTHEEARDLAMMMLGHCDSASRELAETIARESGGNAFFVHELVQCVSARMEVAEGPTTGVLVLDDVLWARIQSLPAEPRRLLEVIAVSGQPLRLAEARLAADLSHDEHGVLAVLRSGRLIRSLASAESEEVETYHDRIRETILSHLPGEVIRDLHRRIALVLEASIAPLSEAVFNRPVDVLSLSSNGAGSGDSSSMKNHVSKRFFDLAYHFDAAGDSERAFPYAISMADQARSQYALEIAEQLYHIAERGAESMDDSARFPVAEHLGDVLMLRGRYPEAAVRFQSALTLTSDICVQARIEGKLGELAFKCGDMKTAVEATERALKMLNNRVPASVGGFLTCLFWETFVQLLHTWFPQLFVAHGDIDGTSKQLLTIRLHNRLAYSYWFVKGKVPCLWSHLRGMNQSERYRPTREMAQAYSSHAPVMSLIPNFSRGIKYAKQSHGIYKALGDLWGQGQSKHFHGHVLYAASRYAECVETCREAIQLLERIGDHWEVNVARYHIALSLYRAGDLSGAVVEANRMYRSGLELGDIQASGGALDPWARACEGHLNAVVLETELKRPRDDVQGTAMVLLAEGVRLFALDRTIEAINVFSRGNQIAEAAGVRNVYVFPHVPWLASAIRRQAEKAADTAPGDVPELLDRAKKAARRALRTARTFQTDLPHALRECGFIAALNGKAQIARRHFEESLLVAERQSARFEYAQTLLAIGRIGQQFAWSKATDHLTAGQEAINKLRANLHFSVHEIHNASVESKSFI